MARYLLTADQMLWVLIHQVKHAGLSFNHLVPYIPMSLSPQDGRTHCAAYRSSGFFYSLVKPGRTFFHSRSNGLPRWTGVEHIFRAAIDQHTWWLFTLPILGIVGNAIYGAGGPILDTGPYDLNDIVRAWTTRIRAEETQDIR